jgi:hypothetical protein
LQRYPAIVACIRYGRQPRQDEIRAVAARIWREGLLQRARLRTARDSFARRRLVFRVARAALTGQAGVRRRSQIANNDL